VRLHRQLAASAGLLRSVGALVLVALSFLTGCSGTTASHSLHIPAAVDSKAPAQRQRLIQVSYKVREHDGTIVQNWKRAPLSGVIGGGGSPGPTTAPSPVPTSTPTATPTPVATGCTSGGTGIVGIEVWNTAHFPHEPPVKSPVAGFSVPFNDDGTAYPQRQDTRTSAAWNVPFPEPPPVFQACAQTKSAPVISGCSYRRSAEGRTFANNLRAWYAAQNWPQAVFRDGRAEAHHIQPLCWGGRNDYKKNGVFLERSVHNRFTAWWGAVKLGSQVTCENDE
jgi:hypothetical protein